MGTAKDIRRALMIAKAAGGGADGGTETVPGRAGKIADYLRQKHPGARVDVSHSTNEFGDSSYVKFGMSGPDNKNLYFETRVSDHPVGDRRSGDYHFHVDKSEPLPQVFKKMDSTVPGWVNAVTKPLTDTERTAKARTSLNNILSEIRGKWPNGGGGVGYRELQRQADKLTAQLEGAQQPAITKAAGGEVLPIDHPERAANLAKHMEGSKTPPVLYHGANVHDEPMGENTRPLGDIDTFDRHAAYKAFNRPEGMDAIGSWFSETPGDHKEDKPGAGQYGDLIYPAHVRITNPWRPKNFDHFIDEMHRAAGRDPKKQRPRGRGSVSELRDKLIRAGHDGIYFDQPLDHKNQSPTWVAFHPEQIKSAIGNNGRYDPTKSHIGKAYGGIAGIGDNNPPVETAPRQLSPLGLYSHGAEAAAALKQTSGSPQQILATLKNLGVKPAEIDASGIANAFSGVPKVTKDDIAEHFRKSSPDIKAKTLTGSNARFKSLTIPGGTNYRETLLQLPPPSWHYEGRRDAPADSNKKSFSEESHYPGEYNTVVHLRKKDRDAGKTLHLDEMQSDWAQKGREHGFGTPISQEEYNAADAPHRAAYHAAMAPHEAAYSAAIAQHRAAFNAAIAQHDAARDAAVAPHKAAFNAAEAQHEAAYEAALAPHDAAYSAAIAPHRAAYSAAIAPHEAAFYDAYDAALAPHDAAYRAAIAPHRAAYNAAMDTHRAARDAAIAPHEAAFNDADAQHRAAFNAAMAPHEAAYSAAEATHLAAFNAADAAHEAALNRVPEAPYVGNTSHWTDLGLKHALFEAAKNGQDRVVWTPGHAQVKRYPGLDEKQKKGLMGYYDDILPKRLMALAREHDPQASFGIHPVGKEKFPSLSLTPEMRESILKNGFKAFSSGGRIHKAGGGSLPTYGADFDAISRLLGYNVGPAPGTYNKPGGATVTPPTLSQMTPATYNGAHSFPTAAGGFGGGGDRDTPGGVPPGPANGGSSSWDSVLTGGNAGAAAGSLLGGAGSLVGRGIGTAFDISAQNKDLASLDIDPMGFKDWAGSTLSGLTLGLSGRDAAQRGKDAIAANMEARGLNNGWSGEVTSPASGGGFGFGSNDPNAPGNNDTPEPGTPAPQGEVAVTDITNNDGGGGSGEVSGGSGAVDGYGQGGDFGYRRGGMAYAAGGSVADDASTQKALALTAQKEAAPREQEPGVRSTDNSKRIIFDTKGNSGKVNGIAVPAHMWYGGNQRSGPFDGMRERNKLRAAVYGPENRDPLTSTKAAAIHRDVLAKHFQKPIAEQKLAEGAALNKLRAAGHFSSGADTLDESEKLDTVRNEKDTKGRSFIGYGSKGVAGHALYTSGTGENQKFHAINTCAGQTVGCGGGTDANGIVDTSKGTCFAPNAEAQYVGAAVKRASHEQAKHDPAMTKDWILAHSGALRSVTDSADKKNLRVLFRPNVVDETDKSSRYLIQHLNDQRASAGKPPIVANSYGKTGELHDPENGYYITHSNTGPKVKPNLSADETSNSRHQSVSENIARDNSRIRNTITATDDRGRDFKNEKGNVTPPKGSYMVTNVKRYSPLDQKMQAAITHAKYWSTGKPESKLSPQELQEGREGHFDGKGNPTTPDKSHYGHTTLDGNRYDYQKQNILHPRLVDVWDAKKKVMHKIPTDSRFLDENFLPKDRYMTKNGKKAGYILMTTPTTSTSDIGHNSSFTHHVDEDIVNKAVKNKGEYEIDAPHLQEAASGNEFVPPHQNKYFARGGNVGRDIDDVDSDEYDVSFPERSHRAQKHLMHRHHHDDHDHDQHHFGHGKPDIDRALRLTAQYQPPLPGRQQSKPGRR